MTSSLRPSDPYEPIPRRRRFVVLAALAALGALLFVPFLQAGAPTPIPPAGAAGFIAAASVIAAIATWFGLGWADRAGLPMPILRAFERRAPAAVDRAGLVWAIGAGVLVALVGLALLGMLDLPSNPASFLVRVGSALFAAVTLETVLHLAIMSGTVRATGHVGAGIAVATLAYVLFHLSSLGGQPAAVIGAATAGNGIGGLVFGWLYARFGFEYLVVAHLVGHAIAVGFG